MKLSSKKLLATHRAILYGSPKTGKTELAGRLAEHFNLLWFDLENGFVTLTKLPAEWQERIELVSIPDTKTYPIAIETMLKVITGKALTVCEAHGKVDCPLCKKEGAPVIAIELNSIPDDTIVVIDSLTQLANSAMSFLTIKESDTYKPEWTDYRNQGSLMDKFLSQVQQAPFNVVCITHETETEMDDGSKRLVPVAGTTNFSRNASKYFDHVVRAAIANKKHGFFSSTTHSLTATAGSRTDVLLEKDIAPSLLRIFKPELFPAEPAAPEKSGTQGQTAVKLTLNMGKK